MSILKVSIRQIKAARALLNWSQAELSLRSGVSEPTIKRLESPDKGALGGREETTSKLVTALENAGIQFIDDGRGHGVMRIGSE